MMRTNFFFIYILKNSCLLHAISNRRMRLRYHLDKQPGAGVLWCGTINDVSYCFTNATQMYMYMHIIQACVLQCITGVFLAWTINSLYCLLSIF